MTCQLPACTRRPRNSITQASKAVLGPFSSRLIRCTTSVTRWVYAPHTLLKSMRGSCCYPLSALQRADQYTAPVWHFIRSDWCGTAPCNTMCTAPSPVARHNSDGVDKLLTDKGASELKKELSWPKSLTKWSIHWQQSQLQQFRGRISTVSFGSALQAT